MPEWLLKNDEYTPIKSREGFIDKSILSMLIVVEKFKRQTEYKNGIIGINALTKLISVLLLIIFISLSKSSAFIIISAVFLLAVINFLPVTEIKKVFKLSFTIAAFTLIILLPSIFLGYGNNSLMIVSKIFISVAFVNCLASSTQWNDIIRALKVFKIPDTFIFVIDITIKYIMILGEFSLNMVYALKLRSVGKIENKSASLAGIVGIMFIKSKEMSEEMYEAMECRGFAGEYKYYRRFKFSFADYAAIIFDITIIFIYFYFDRL